MSDELKKGKALGIFRPARIAIIISIAVLVNVYFVAKNLFSGSSRDKFLDILLNPNWLWLLAALVVLFARDFGYIFRIRSITSKKLNYRKSFYTILLWEFASAATPSVVGGTAVAIFILRRHGIKLGKAVAYVMLTAIMDNLFFLLAAPIVIYSYTENLFLGFDTEAGKTRMEVVFYTSYGLIFLYTFLMVFSTLIMPRYFRKLILRMVRKFNIKRWRKGILDFSGDMYVASKELKGKSASYWTKASLSTIFIWSARYFILNCLLAAFLPENMNVQEHLDAFSRQIILWITMLVSPSPGGTGFAQYFLKKLFGNSISLDVVAVIWRALTYLIYLIAGAVFLPIWLNKKFEPTKKKP